ncbi:hypothetical protein [Isoalcanivorax beigongshangi]|uniref:Toxin CptA n=1 Tax=Isoalcanivorax beigongshangi TaxID=3238810 RepID=A0ABV4AHC8_9GAMM
MSWDCWGQRKPLTPDWRARVWQLLPAVAAALAVLDSSLHALIKAVLLLAVVLLLRREWRRHDPAVALWLWPQALLVETASGRRQRYAAPFFARHWPGCVVVGRRQLLFRHSMDDDSWRCLQAVLHLNGGAPPAWFRRGRNREPESNP